ncbi:MAG: hypothetical protein ACOX3X_08325 [Eubacteriales bacterium]
MDAISKITQKSSEGIDTENADMRRYIKLLCGFWLISVVVRFIIALSTSVTPSIMPDESLYFQISDSLAGLGRVYFRGQPINYTYITYPLLLVPLHWLSNSINIFRAIQLVNAMIMSAAVFPAFYLGRMITKSNKRALVVALITLLAPDMAMINHIMTDALAYTLIILTLYIAAKVVESKEKTKHPYILGGLAFLVYTVKPGYIAIGIAVVACLLFNAWLDRDKERIIQAIKVAGTMAVLYIIWRLFLGIVLKVDFELDSLYQTQTAALSFETIKKFFSGLLLYAIYIPVAFLLFPIILPLANYKLFSKNTRSILSIVYFSLFFVILGAVYIIYVDEIGSNPYASRIHARYVAAFLPVLVAFCMAPELKKAKFGTFAAVSTLGVLSGLYLLKDYPINSTRQYPVDAMLLSYYTTDSVYFNGKLLVPMFCILFFTAMAYYIYKKGLTVAATRVLISVIAVVFIINGIFAYDMNKHSMSLEYAADAKQVVKMVGGRNALFVAEDGAYMWQPAIALDNASRGEIYVDELDDAVSNTYVTGSFGNFVPKNYWMAVSQNKIPKPDAIIVNYNFFDSNVVNPNAKIEYTDNKYYAVITPPENGPWLHSSLSGTNQNWVVKGSRLTLFDPAVLSGGTVVFSIQARAGEGTSVLTCFCGESKIVFNLDTDYEWYSIEVPNFDTNSPLSVYFENTSGNVFIKTYLIGNR